MLSNTNNSIYYQSFVCIQSNGIVNDKTVLFDQKMGLKQIQPFWVSVEVEVMEKKEYSPFPKASWLEPHYVWCHDQDTRYGGSYPSAEMHLIYSTASVEWTEFDLDFSI